MAITESANSLGVVYPEIMFLDGASDIYLQVAKREDASAFHKALAGNEEHLANLGSVKIEDITVESLQAAYTDPEDDDFVRYRIMNKDGIIGSISLHGYETQLRSVKLGGWIDKAHEGKGYVTTAAKELIDHTFNSLAVDLIKAEIDPENTRSEQVVQRLGAHLTEAVVMEKKADGRIRPQRVWEIERP